MSDFHSAKASARSANCCWMTSDACALKTKSELPDFSDRKAVAIDLKNQLFDWQIKHTRNQLVKFFVFVWKSKTLIYEK